MENSNIKEIVRKKYSGIASGNPGCGCSCSCGAPKSIAEISRDIGYSNEDISKAPEGSNLGLGCGNPVGLASLNKGDVVLDMGSGAGFDSFLAASRVGSSGKVIGVDLTMEMIEKARKNAIRCNCKSVEFRLGDIENLPVEDNSIDKIISNCVINLSPDKEKTFREAYRVLKSGGKIFISDIVLTRELPPKIKESSEYYTACVAGASLKDAYLDYIEKAGFNEVRILDEMDYPISMPDKGCGVQSESLDCIKSISIAAEK